MRCEKYRSFFTQPFLMGPNSIRLLDELLHTYPLSLPEEGLILDLGCGSGLTSLFAAQETGAKVCACDLWISEEENRRRFAQWGMQERITPAQQDAACLQFEKESFDAMISVDAYHYFAGKEGFFSGHILPLIKKGGVVLIAVPGIKEAYDGQSEALLSPWLGDEAHMFRSASFWRRMLQDDRHAAQVVTWEMDGFDLPWQEWFETKNPYALGDLEHYETIIKPYTAFVGMMVRKK